MLASVVRYYLHGHIRVMMASVVGYYIHCHIPDMMASVIIRNCLMLYGMLLGHCLGSFW